LSIGKTSTAVKRKWIEANYSTIRAAIPKETAEAFREKCKANGDSQAAIVKKAIEQYLDEKK
jgi:predicted DNA-binding protein